MKMYTTIQVKMSTLERLKYFKQYSKESYDEVINKVMDVQEEGELSDDAIKDIEQGLKEIREGKGKPIEQVAAELGVKL